MAVNLNVNGSVREVASPDDTPLLWVLRDELGLTGTKFGCGIAQCGACTVHVDGLPRRSCVTPISTLADSQVVTIEGVSGREADAVRKAWAALDVPQCGYCQSGQVMSATALLLQNGKPDDLAIDRGMAGNICRCATYVRIRQAIKDASVTLGG